MPTESPSKYLSIDEASEFLGCAPITIRREISRGRLKARRFARRILIDPRELERALKPVTRVGGDAA